MKVKELERIVNVSWSPASYHPILLAAGTAAQQLDASFSTTASLELFSLNLAEPGLDLELKCSVPSQNRFHKIVWGGGSQNGSAGIVVGGCDSGKLQMYNVNKILGGEDGLISHQDRHSGAVRSLDFNPFQTNLLASGASESEIFIWDLNNTSTPMTPGAKAQPYEDVMALAWNRQVQHILVSTFATRCIVWDLRKNEPIIKLTDSNSRVRWKVVGWNPDVATQLCLGSEEDSNPVVQLWDLRFATTPLKSLHSHSRGVLSLAWCSQDSDLLISSGKDNRIICWNPNSNHPTGEIQCEIGNTQQWIFELCWCPRNPNLIASCSADSHASIYNLTGAPMQPQTSNKIADSFPGMDELSVDQAAAPSSQSTVELVKPPRWMRRPVGASFSFGGKLVSFGGDGGSVIVSQVSTDIEYLDRARNVLDLLNSGRAAELCTSRQDPIWSYIEATFAPRPHAAIKHLLGYTEVVKSNINEQDIDALNNQMTGLGQGDTGAISNNIMDDPYETNQLNGTEAFDSIVAKKESVPEPKHVPNFHIPIGNDGEGSICKYLLGGDMDEAVSACLNEQRSADALVLAMTAGSSLLLKTQQKYFDSQTGTGQAEHLIRAIVTNEWNDFVSACHVDSWKEALVALLTYARHEAIPQLCEDLGKRLEEAGGDHALGADVCYITAGSIGSIIRKKITESNLTTPGALQELIELVMVGEAAALCQGKQISTDGEVSDLFTDYALILASQGDYQTALSYLQHTSGEQVADMVGRLHANMGIKQDYQQQQQQGQFQQNQGYQSQQNQPRRFSGQQQQQQQQHTQPQQAHFPKMSPRAALRTNVYQQSQTPVPTFPLQPEFQDHQRPSSNSPGLQQGSGGKKYVIDPSVGGDTRGNRGMKFYQGGGPGVGVQEMAPPSFQPASHTFEPSSHPGSVIHNPLSQQPQHPPQRQPGLSTQNYLTGSPGWNDPPVLSSSSKSQNKNEPIGPKAPILNPLGPSPHDAPYQYIGTTASGGMQPMGMRPPLGTFQPPGAPPPLGGVPPTGMYARQMGAASPFLGSSQPPLPPPSHLSSSSQPAAQPGAMSSSMGILPSQRKTSLGTAPPSMAASTHPSLGPVPPSMGMPPLTTSPASLPLGPPPSMGAAPSPMGPTPSMNAAPPTMGPMSSSIGSAPPLLGTFKGPIPQPPSQSMPPSHPPMHNLTSTMRSTPPPMGTSVAPLTAGPPQITPSPSPMTTLPHSGAAAPPLNASGQFSGPHPMPVNPSNMPTSNMQPGSYAQQSPSRLQQIPTPVSSAPSFQQPPVSSSPAPQVNGGYGDPPTPRHVAASLPDSFKPLQATLESLRIACFNASNNPQVKRKLEDIARKLESLYEALRESRLSQETLSNLEELVGQSREGNYPAALTLHTRMISGPDFSQISSFMPALKVLIQSALQLNVFIQ